MDEARDLAVALACGCVGMTAGWSAATSVRAKAEAGLHAHYGAIVREKDEQLEELRRRVAELSRQQHRSAPAPAPAPQAQRRGRHSRTSSLPPAPLGLVAPSSPLRVTRVDPPTPERAPLPRVRSLEALQDAGGEDGRREGLRATVWGAVSRWTKNRKTPPPSPDPDAPPVAEPRTTGPPRPPPTLDDETEARDSAWFCGRVFQTEELAPALFPLAHCVAERGLVFSSRHFMYVTTAGDIYSHPYGEEVSGWERPRLVQSLALEKAMHGTVVTSLACGWKHFVAVAGTGEVFTWGSGDNGRLGHGEPRNEQRPRLVLGLLGHRVRLVQCGTSHSVAVTDQGSVFSWGKGKHGCLGHGNALDQITPKVVAGLGRTRVRSVACGRHFTASVDDEGHVCMWGRNVEGQCGREELDDVPSPSAVTQLPPVTELALGVHHVLALGVDRVLYSWGNNELGQLGVGTAQRQPLAQAVVGVHDSEDPVVAVAAGDFHSAAVTASGRVFTWGINSSGTLGHGTTTSRIAPKQVEGLPPMPPTHVRTVVAGRHHTVILESDQRSSRRPALPEVSPDHPPVGLTDSERHSGLSEIRARHRRQLKACGSWEAEIIPRWAERKDSKLTKKLWREGIPLSVRRTVWPLAIGNVLKINPGQFAIYRERAKVQMVSVRSAVDAGAAGAGSIGKEDSLELISRDLQRTFPALRLFGEQCPFYEQLRQVLSTYCCYRPDVGYIQGMSYLAAMLCLYEPEDTYMAFQCLANVLVSEHMFVFYCHDRRLTKRYFELFNEALANHSRSLHACLERHQLPPSLYLYPWMQTLFTRCLRLDVASRVWDCYLLDGTEFLFRTALAILDLFAPTLKAASFEDCASILTGSPSKRRLWEDTITEQALFHTVSRIVVPNSILHALRTLMSDVYFYNPKEEAKSKDLQEESLIAAMLDGM